MKKATACILVLLLVLLACGCAATTDQKAGFKAFTVTDLGGHTISIDKPVERVAATWGGAVLITIVTGNGDKIIAANESLKEKDSWLAVMYPRIMDIYPSITANGQISVEEILAQKPDIVFCSSQKEYDQMSAAGLKVAFLALYSIDDLKKAVKMVGQVFGDTGYRNAVKYCNYVDDTLKKVGDKVKAIPDDKRAKVYASWGSDIMRTNGAETLTNEWIEAAGGINTMKSYMSKTANTASMEQIIKENPSVVLCGGSTMQQSLDGINANPGWKEVDAVKNGKLYKDPAGAYPWERFGVEPPLQVLWAAKTIYPDQFADLNMVTEVKNFYKSFFNYDLTDAQAQLMLECKKPSGSYYQ